MTEFTQTLRHYCRNPRCGSKLPTPVDNSRKAFCTRGCHSSFYLKRCIVCEATFTKTRANQEVCRKARCRRAIREAKERFRYYPTSAAFEASKTPDFIGSKPLPANDRAWRIMAGPTLSPSAFHCATVGAAEAIEDINRTNDRHRYEAKRKSTFLIGPNDPPANIVGGYKFPGAPVVDIAPMQSSPPVAPAVHGLSIPDDLSIPDFLRRTSLDAPLRVAA